MKQHTKDRERCLICTGVGKHTDWCAVEQVENFKPSPLKQGLAKLIREWTESVGYRKGYNTLEGFLEWLER